MSVVKRKKCAHYIYGENCYGISSSNRIMDMQGNKDVWTDISVKWKLWEPNVNIIFVIATDS